MLSMLNKFKWGRRQRSGINTINPNLLHFVGVDHMLCGLWFYLHYLPMSHKKVNFKTFPTVLMTFANRMDSDQAWQSLGQDLDPICLIISRSFWKRWLWKKKKTHTTKRHAKLPNRCLIWVCTVWLCPSKSILGLFWLFCLFVLMLYIPSATFQLWRDGLSWVDLSVCLIWLFTSHQQSFSYVGTGLPWLNQY